MERRKCSAQETVTKLREGKVLIAGGATREVHDQARTVAACWRRESTTRRCGLGWVAEPRTRWLQQPWLKRLRNSKLSARRRRDPNR